MKTLIFKNPAIILFMAIVHLNVLAVTGQEASKTFEQIFPITGHASLEIENRYGSVDVRNWEKQEISVEVDVTVSHSDRETAERQLSYININFSQNENSVKAITEIDQRVSKQWTKWFSLGREGTEIKIDYIIYTPRESDLKITHRYGDIFINEATGHTHIDLRYGNLQANQISRDNTRPLSEINLAYSTKATITEADWLQVNMKYSDLLVTRCRALVASSSYSKLQVDQASSIVTESRYGEFNLGDINNFAAESAYTNYTINRVGNSIDVESRYGNIRVNDMPADFSKIRFISSYGNMRVGLSSAASYKIDASASYGSIDIIPGAQVSRESNGRQSTISGTVGSLSDPQATVEISTRYGNVDLTAR
ncbi:MAG: DUF4097 family beta strand repeat-containing protein [Bacteroidales bacterium]